MEVFIKNTLSDATMIKYGGREGGCLYLNGEEKIDCGERRVCDSLE
jgi:hypothetical protein